MKNLTLLISYLFIFILCSLSSNVAAQEQEYLISDGNIVTDSGIFYDDGGPTEDYSGTQNRIVTICPETTDKFIVLTFTEIAISPSSNVFGIDELSIFDGVGEICLLSKGLNKPMIFIASASSGGCLTIHFRSNALNESSSGWKATISTTNNPSEACFKEYKRCDWLFTENEISNNTYKESNTQIYHLCPENPDDSFVTLDFFDLDIKQDDDLSVYDGIGVSCLLATNITEPQTFQASDNSGACLTVVFSPETAETTSQWQANVNCTTSSIAPPVYCDCSRNPEPSNSCVDAPLLNDPKGFCGNSSIFYTADSPSLSDNFECGSINNNSFMRFIPRQSSVEIAYKAVGGTYEFCAGLQLAVYKFLEVCDSTYANPNQIDCINIEGGLNAEGIFKVTGLRPNEEYYFMIDGFYGGACHYYFEGIRGFTTCPWSSCECALQTCNFEERTYDLQIPVQGIGDTMTYKVYELNNDIFQLDTAYFIDYGELTSIDLGPYPMGSNYHIIIESGVGLNGCSLDISGTDECNSLTNIAEIEKVQPSTLFHLFPNPSTNYLTIESQENMDTNDLKIEWIDMTGKVVLSKSSFETGTRINTAFLNAGIYLVRISTKDKIEVKKWVKE